MGRCCSKPAFMGFAPASVLCALSFADVLDEMTGEGYQRRFSPKHSLDFRRYLQNEGSATIPLTFNLRPEHKKLWTVGIVKGAAARLCIQKKGVKVLAQVDCQHRLGSIADLNICLPFMTFIGLNLREEMQIFNVINGKAQGLSSSLLDFHRSKLTDNLAEVDPQLYIALALSNSPDSPWYGQLDKGGKTVGPKRRASLRTMQLAVKRFLTVSHILAKRSPDEALRVVLAFWRAIVGLLHNQWQNPRNHLLTKGVGVYALMSLAGKIYAESGHAADFDEPTFRELLSPFITCVDWRSDGQLKGYGGEKGADEAFRFLDVLRKNSLKNTPSNAQ
jgi:DNA sulfur modification protein DndB